MVSYFIFQITITPIFYYFVEYRVEDIEMKYLSDLEILYFTGTSAVDGTEELYLPVAENVLDFKHINKIVAALPQRKTAKG